MFAREQKQAEEIKVRNHVGTEVQERKDQAIARIKVLKSMMDNKQSPNSPKSESILEGLSK